jgi:glycosyltransferase involved in cell wall biosynthesis
MEAKKNILLFQRIIPKYRVSVFNQLYVKLGIIVCYSESQSSSSLKTTINHRFPTEKLKRFFFTNSVTAMIQNPLPVLRKHKPAIVISEGSLSYLTVWVILLLRSFFKYKLIIWTHGVKYREMDKPFRTFSGGLKLFLFHKADAIIVYSDKRKEIVAKHIANPHKVFLANNTLDTESLMTIYKIFFAKGKSKVKEELGWGNKFNLIYIGRLLTSKGLDILFNVFKILPDDMDIALHIIGDGPENYLINKMASENINIHSYGAVLDDEVTGKYLFASDLMVMPGYVGLSVIHAFSFGCPVLTCLGDFRKGPFHSPEIEYITDGYNGFLLESNPVIIAQKIQSVLKDGKWLEQLSKNAFRTIEEKATIGMMISGIEQAILYLKK